MPRLELRGVVGVAVVWAFASFLAGCNPASLSRPPPLDRFYYPTGVVVSRPGTTTDGFLYVASGNYDKRFANGTLIAVSLDQLQLPAFGALIDPSGPVLIPDLKLRDDGQSAVELYSFAGVMRGVALGNPGPRLFVASRAEENRLHAIDTNADALTCVGDREARNCGPSGIDLTSVASDEDGRPQARAPVGVGIGGSVPKVMVGHESAARLPQSTEIGGFYVFSTSAEEPGIATEDFTSITDCVNGFCLGGSEAVVVGQRYAFLTGRIGRTSGGQGLPGNLLRWVDHAGATATEFRPEVLPGRVGTAGLERIVQLFEGRGIVLRADESRLYMIARGLDSIVASGPTMLLAVDLDFSDPDTPAFTLAHAVTLPERCNEAVLVPRGADELVVMTCGDAGAVVIYDSGQRALVANARGVGNQPFGIAVDERSPGARFYVTSFVDGQVAVLDLPDLSRPWELRVVARLGRRQTCIVRASDPSCTEDRL